jgi:succinate dehydrogenase/fumarate reductase flavoprotein subunit
MSVDKIDNGWDREVDVVVLGAGPAGMAAAIVSKNEGLEPLILEKTDQVGGTGAWSVGMMWFVDSTPMRAAGFKDSTENARRYLSATVGNAAPSALQDAYVEQGRVALDYLLKHSNLEVMAVPILRSSSMPGSLAPPSRISVLRCPLSPRLAA